MSGAAIVTTTVGSEADARALGRALVEARLAACVQIGRVGSIYRWNGAIETAEEYVLSCKIATADFALVEAEIGRLHPYEVPEIVMTPVEAGSAAYLDWIARETTRS